MKISRRSLTGTTAAALAIGVIAFAAPAAHADGGAPPCYGPTCYGKSPYLENNFGTACVDDAVDVKGSALFMYGDAYIVIRWSAWCGANWVAWRTDLGYGPSYNGFYVQSSGGSPVYNGSNYYTNMTDGSNGRLVQECATGSGCLGWF
jgi:hypothetical protein